MRSFSPFRRLLLMGVVFTVVSGTRAAAAQSDAQGFATERLYLSAPGAGWFVMDDLSMDGGLGGAVALTTGYARKPLQVVRGSERLPVVSEHLFSDFAFAATFERFRFYLNFDAPISSKGRSGTVSGYQFTAPSLALSSSPDSFEDARIATDVRVLGVAHGPFRLGFGAQLLFPTGKRIDYDSDGTYRAMARALFAGDVGAFSYAGQVGAHVRPLNESPAPDSPRGSELLFGVAGGVRFPLVGSLDSVILVGPELFGVTAFNSFLGARTTGLEGLMTARLDTVSDRAALLRFKLGAGGGLDPRFGAPEWRVVCAIELSDQFTHHDSP